MDILLLVLYFAMVNFLLIAFSVLGLFRIRRGTLSWTPYKIGVGVQLFASFGIVIRITEGGEPPSFENIGELVCTAALIVLFYVLTKRAIEKDHRI